MCSAWRCGYFAHRFVRVRVAVVIYTWIGYIFFLSVYVSLSGFACVY